MMITALHECSICDYPTEFGSVEAFESHVYILHMDALMERGEELTPHNICWCVTDPDEHMLEDIT